MTGTRKIILIMAVILIGFAAPVVSFKPIWSIKPPSVLVCGLPHHITQQKTSSSKIPLLQCFPTQTCPAIGLNLPYAFKLYVILYICGMYVLFGCLYVTEQERSPKYARRFFGLIIAGFFITAAAALILGNMSGFIPLTFIELCELTGLINWRECFRSTLSTYPCLVVSLLSYPLSACLFWITSQSLNKRDLAFLGFYAVLATGSLIGFGWDSFSEFGTSALDILSGYALGGIMGWFYVGKLSKAISPDVPVE